MKRGEEKSSFYLELVDVCILFMKGILKEGDDMNIRFKDTHQAKVKQVAFGVQHSEIFCILYEAYLCSHRLGKHVCRV